MSFFAYGETQVVHGSVIGVPFVRARVLNGLFFAGSFPVPGLSNIVAHAFSYVPSFGYPGPLFYVYSPRSRYMQYYPSSSLDALSHSLLDFTRSADFQFVVDYTCRSD